jgi:hypothetical protein
MMGDRLACELRIEPAVDDVALVFGAFRDRRFGGAWVASTNKSLAQTNKSQGGGQSD